MLVKQSETAIAVQLCRFLCRFTQLFIYQRKKNTYQYIKVVSFCGQKNGEFPYIQVFSGPVA